MNALKIITVTIVIIVIQPSHAQANQQLNPTSEILNILEKYHIPGAGVALVAKDSIIWMGGLGQADVKNNIPVTTSTLFTIGSIAKTFAGAAALIAQEKGMLDINDAIQEIVPSMQYDNRWRETDPVRLIHLLEHTSGFDESHFHLVARSNASTPLAEILKLSKNSLKIRWRPGNYYEYNTLGYVIAAHVIEERAGLSYDEFVRHNLLIPLEMPQATYHPSEASTPKFSRGYEGKDFIEVPFPDLPVWPAGTLTASIEEMSNFVIMLINDGRFKNQQILSPASVKSMETPETSIRAKAGIQYGYGKGLEGNFENGHLFYGHGGQAGGFTSSFGYSSELEVGYVILLNNRDGNKALKAIKKELLSAINLRDKPEKSVISEMDGERLKMVTGCYQRITGLGQLGKISEFIVRLIDMQFIVQENSRLHQKSVVGGKRALHHVKNLLFRRSDEPIATSVFVESQDGNLQWLDEAAYQRIPVWSGYLQFYTAVACVLIILLAFLMLLFWLPVKIIKKEKHILLQSFPFWASCSFLGMIISFATLYDPTKLYSAGAILFFLFGWSFFIFSFLGLTKTIATIYSKIEISSWIKYHTILTSTACCITASYLLYWDIIGLALWNY